MHYLDYKVICPLEADVLVNLCEFFILAQIGKGEQVNAVMRWVGPEVADLMLIREMGTIILQIKS